MSARLVLSRIADFPDESDYALTDKTRPNPWVSALDLAPRSIGDLGTRDHTLLTNLSGDRHPDHFYLLGRAGGQNVIGGTGASEVMVMRGTSNANLGLIQLESPLQIQSVAAATALESHAVTYSPTENYTAAFVGGGMDMSPTIDFSNSTFIWEAFRGAPTITSGVNPAFAAFTVLQALPVLRTTSGFKPLNALVLNAGPTLENDGGTFGLPNTTTAIIINAVPQVRVRQSFDVLNMATTTAMQWQPTYSTVSGSAIDFGVIRLGWAKNPTVALFQPSAGLESMSAYYAFDVDNITFGGNVPKVALRSALAPATNAYFLQNNGGAESDFGAGSAGWNDNAGVELGSGDNVLINWNGSALEFAFAAFGENLTVTNPADDRLLFNTTEGDGEFNFNCDRFSLGAQTGAVGNQVGVFVAGARSTGVAGEWSDFLLTQAANITIDHAMGLVAGWTINAPSMTLGTGSVTSAGALNIGGNPNQGSVNRFGLRILSNPSGGSGVNAALWITAGRSRFDGIVDINNGIALGGGAAATLGTIGGSGPTAAAQAQWVQIEINGVNHWIPVWT